MCGIESGLFCTVATVCGCVEDQKGQHAQLIPKNPTPLAIVLWVDQTLQYWYSFFDYSCVGTGIQ